MVGRKEAEEVIKIWLINFCIRSQKTSVDFEKIEKIQTLMADYCGHMCGWHSPWDTESPERRKSSIAIYRQTLEYPTQTLCDDIHDDTIESYYKKKNENNVLTDCILALTQYNPFAAKKNENYSNLNNPKNNIRMINRIFIRKKENNNKAISKYNVTNNNNNINNIDTSINNKESNSKFGWYLGNPMNGHWYQLGNEIPKISHLRLALNRNSMATAFEPRNNKLYFAGGYAIGMPVSSLAELDLNTMKVRNIGEMQHKHQPRAYASMVFWPDNLCCIIGGTNCWGDVYNSALCYDFEKNNFIISKNNVSNNDFLDDNNNNNNEGQNNDSLNDNNQSNKDNNNCKNGPISMPKLKYARYAHTASIIEDRSILVSGGCNQTKNIMECEMYFRDENIWQPVAPLKIAMQNCQSLRYCFENVMMVSSNTRKVQTFELRKNEWNLAGSLNRIYDKGVKLCTIDYKLIAAQRTDLTMYEIYDKTSNKWIATTTKNHPIYSLYYPQPFEVGNQIIDWYHLGRRFW